MHLTAIPRKPVSLSVEFSCLQLYTHVHLCATVKLLYIPLRTLEYLLRFKVQHHVLCATLSVTSDHKHGLPSSSKSSSQK